MRKLIQFKAIRETWGKNIGKFNISLIFHLGFHEDDNNENLNIEHQEYGDLLQNSFIDNYQNLTCELNLFSGCFESLIFPNS